MKTLAQLEDELCRLNSQYQRNRLDLLKQYLNEIEYRSSKDIFNALILTLGQNNPFLEHEMMVFATSFIKEHKKRMQYD